MTLHTAASPLETSPKEPAERADRRILRTRRMLSEAILALIIEKPYESISIRDITERADVNRATFYHHYQSKDELLGATLEAQFDALVAEFDNIPASVGLLYDLQADMMTFRHVQEHAALYGKLLGPQGPPQIPYRMTMYVAGIFRKLVERSEGVELLRYPIEPVSHHMASSLIGVVRWWLINDMPGTVEEVARMSHELCLNGIASGIPGGINLDLYNKQK